MKKFVVSFLITSAFGICTAVGVLAEKPEIQRPPEPRPHSEKPSSFEKSVGKMWDKITNQNDRTWERKKRRGAFIMVGEEYEAFCQKQKPSYGPVPGNGKNAQKLVGPSALVTRHNFFRRLASVLREICLTGC